MEKRILLAIILSFIVVFLYQIFFVKAPSTPPDVSKKEIKIEEKKEKIQKPPIKTQIISEKRYKEKIISEKEIEILVRTPYYEAIWTNKGGILKSWKLKRHKDDDGNQLELVSQLADEIGIYPFYILTDLEDYNSKINNALYKFSKKSLNLKPGEREKIEFIYSDGESILIKKIFYFNGDNYLLKPEIEIWINGRQISPQILWGPGLRKISETEKKRKFTGGRNIAILIGNKVYRVKEEKIKPEENVYLYPRWAAYEDTYFTALFLLNPNKSQARALKVIKNSKEFYFLSVTNLEEVFIGPKEYDALLKLGNQTKKLIKFGFFGWIAEILLRALQSIHKFVPNYGFSIMILTLIIKILFFPLTFSSSKSMAKMQEIQPKIKALRAKYKKAKTDIAQRRKLNEEMMKLYKEHGINPAGGCLPLLIQIPVFWGFFRLLLVSIELRHSPFILWIKDLSVKDPYYVTPILMGITQYISQKMTPSSADPTQARIMLIMPVIMTLFFMNFQSGLVLYWLTNNILQIAQQYAINKMIKKSKREKKGKDGGKKKRR
jgi:YidC/Oxa1 family membrane protein insertase